MYIENMKDYFNQISVQISNTHSLKVKLHSLLHNLGGHWWGETKLMRSFYSQINENSAKKYKKNRMK